MKRSYIYGLLLSFLLGSSLYAQRAEYWLDSDPGRGKATALTLSGNDGSLTLNTVSLSAGIHVVGIRTAQGRKWGQTYTHTFFVPHGHGSGTLNGVEWWLDEDPGRGQATAIAATGSDTQVTIPVLTDQLAAGVHTIGVRARQDELWGQTYTHTFFVPHGHGSGTLNGVEWWLNEDPGRGKATAIAATGSDTQVTIPVPTDQLSEGVHTLGARRTMGTDLHTHVCCTPRSRCRYNHSSRVVAGQRSRTRQSYASCSKRGSRTTHPTRAYRWYDQRHDTCGWRARTPERHLGTDLHPLLPRYSRTYGSNDSTGC